MKKLIAIFFAALVISAAQTSGTASVSASASTNGQSVTSTVTLPVVPVLALTINCSPLFIYPGAAIPCSATINQPAADDTTVALTVTVKMTTGSITVTAPPSVLIPKGGTTVSFTAKAQ